MPINKYEKAKIISAIRVKLEERRFTFDTLEIYEKADSRLIFEFAGVKNPAYKTVRLLSHDSWVKETTLFTSVIVRLRFLQNNRKSPFIGHNLVTFKMNIS